MTKLTAYQWDLHWVPSLQIYSWVIMERNWLQELDMGKVLLYRRYVDDIFCMFKNDIDAEKFFKYLNSKHSNIRFTMEKGTNKFLPFLDVLVKNEGRKFTTSVYRKKTSIGTFANATKIKLKQICDKYCKNTNVLVAFLSLNSSIPKFLQYYVVYQFTCSGCNACYIGEIRCHFNNRIKEHLGKDKNMQILKHLQENRHCGQVSNFDCFDVINCDTSHFRL